MTDEQLIRARGVQDAVWYCECGCVPTGADIASARQCYGLLLAEVERLRRDVESLELRLPHVEVCRDPYCSHDDHFPESYSSVEGAG